MTEPRSSADNPTPTEQERRDQEELTAADTNASPQSVGETFTSDAERADSYAAAERMDAAPNADGLVEPNPIEPGGLPTLAIVTAIVIIVVLVALVIIFV